MTTECEEQMLCPLQTPLDLAIVEMLEEAKAKELMLKQEIAKQEAILEKQRKAKVLKLKQEIAKCPRPNINTIDKYNVG